MSNRLRPLLLKLLLLAVCFHAAVGAALHESRHLGALARVAAQALEDAAPDGSETPAGPVEEAHGICAWCTACGAQVAQRDAPPMLAAAPQAGMLRLRADATGFVPQPPRRAFAARDPPVLPS